MPVQNPNLLDIDTDKLFEEHSISEILDIQKKLLSEIERKREELRTMVGERYRDLIEAADTIADMKQTAEGVISHIDNMSSKCQDLQQKHLVGFKLDAKKWKDDRGSRNAIYNSISIQIKILMDVPEQIWSAVGREDYILAAQLFLLSCHINTGMRLQSGGDEAPSSIQVLQWFPLIPKLWSSISHFRDEIVCGCQRKLQSHSLTCEEACNCLTALVLLEGVGSVDLLRRLLELRTQALRDILQADNHDSVRSRVCTSLKLLVHTVTLLYSCFLGDGDDSSGFIWKQLKIITSRNAPPAIHLGDFNDSLTARFLPPLIQEFRPSTTEPVNPVPPGEMREHVTQWLDWVRGYVEKQVSEQLSLVSSVRGLHGICEEAASLGSVANWDMMCQRLMIPRGLNLWDVYFQPLITHRAKALVTQQWSAAICQLQSRLTVTLQEISLDKCGQPEHDLRWFVWKEWLTDLPQGDDRAEHQTRGLVMKTRGYSPCVERLCAVLDSHLLALLQDLEPYLHHDELQRHLNACSSDNIHNLVDHMKMCCLLQASDGCVVLIARLLQALCDLCPSLRKCFYLNSKAVSPWQEACQLLQQESVAAWQLWQQSVCTRLQEVMRLKLAQPQHLNTLLLTVPQWDVVSIEEEADEGRTIRSDIRVPSQPSLPLQSLLCVMCQHINAVAPHTIPRKIQQDLVEMLVTEMLQHYERLSDGAVVSQAQALQALLDVKYLVMLLVPRDFKPLISKAQVISDKFEDKVDPFDLDVFCPYIQNNIKRSVQRSQSLLGVLVAWPEKLAVVSGLRNSSSAAVEDPSVLSLCSSAPWFSLLPVTGPPGSRLPSSIPQISQDKPQRKKTSPKPKSEQTPGELVRSGAAAFFGAMSSDWF